MLNRSKLKKYISHLTGIILIAACLIIGVAGLILPIIPGILFLVLGAFLAAKMSSKVDSWLKQSPTVYAYIDMADGFGSMSNLDRIKLLGWASLQSCIDIIQLSLRIIAKSFRYLKVQFANL